MNLFHIFVYIIDIDVFNMFFLFQVEREMCSASAEFEDFVLQFMDRYHSSVVPKYKKIYNIFFCEMSPVHINSLWPTILLPEHILTVLNASGSTFAIHQNNPYIPNFGDM